MLGLEDVAAYKDLFSPEDWNAIQTGEWDETEVSGTFPVTDDSPPEVTIHDPPGEVEGNDERFKIECDRCGVVGAAGTGTEPR